MKNNKKPKIIIEQARHHEVLQLLVRIDKKTQIRYLLQYLKEIILLSRNYKMICIDFNDILKDRITSFSAEVLKDKYVDISYFVNDEGKGKTAFIFLNMITSKKNFNKLSNFSVEKYFEI